MLRPALAMVIASFVLSACGSGSGSATDPEEQSVTASTTETPEAPETSYFEEADSQTINRPAEAARRAAVKALDRGRIKACNTIEVYPAWRRCWHGLLDPLSTSLTSLAGAFTTFEKRDLPNDCVTQTRAAAKTFSTLADDVDAVLSGIDSDKRKEQVRAGASYSGAVNGVSQGFTKPFQKVTGVCYSPKDLASINVSPSPSP